MPLSKPLNNCKGCMDKDGLVLFCCFISSWSNLGKSNSWFLSIKSVAGLICIFFMFWQLKTEQKVRAVGCSFDLYKILVYFCDTKRICQVLIMFNLLYPPFKRDLTFSLNPPFKLTTFPLSGWMNQGHKDSQQIYMGISKWNTPKKLDFLNTWVKCCLFSILDILVLYSRINLMPGRIWLTWQNQNIHPQVLFTFTRSENLP